LFCGDGGWLAAAKAINAIGLFLKEKGVKFGFGGYVRFTSFYNYDFVLGMILTERSAGTFKQPLFAADGTTCIGVETVDGTQYHADKVVLAAGAWSSTLVDLEDQCVSKVRL
jgi:sarcosine oxidase/L-pipecolate oxidase